MIVISFTTLLNRITNFIKALYYPGTWAYTILGDTMKFINSHKLVLFFILIPLIFTGINLLRRLIHS